MQVAISIIGKDRPGIISELTSVLSENGANIEDASMTLLQGHFAMIIVVECADDNLENIQNQLRNSDVLNGFTLEFSILDIQNSAKEIEVDKDSVHYVLHLSVKDTIGVVANITKILGENFANVIDCSTRINKETGVFTLSLDVDIPVEKESLIVEKVQSKSSEYDGDIVFLKIDYVDL